MTIFIKKLPQRLILIPHSTHTQTNILYQVPVHEHIPVRKTRFLQIKLNVSNKDIIRS